MEISTEREGTLLVARAVGRLDSINAREFDDALKSAISDSDQVLIMDLEEVSYVSSAGLRVILLTAKTLQQRSAKLLICSLAEPIREVFEISGFDKIIPIHANLGEAKASIG